MLKAQSSWFVGLALTLITLITPASALGAMERELTFPGGEEGVTLAGTLTLPDGAAADRQVPGIILVTGSGPQDRDQSIFGKKPFAVLAREFTLRGYAVLRYDDRGVAQSTGKFADATIDDFIKDAQAALTTLADQPEVNAEQLFVLGHSEGAAAAAELAAAGKVTAGAIYLAGAALPGHAVLTDQSVHLARATGADEEQLEKIEATHGALMQAVLANAPAREIVEKTVALIAAQTDGTVPEANMRVMAGQVRLQLNSPWMRRFMEHDPSQAASRATVPALALFGTLDLQVTPDANAQPMREALEASGQEPSRVIVLEGKNHLFQNARTGIVQEYAMLEGDLEPEVAQTIADWMDEVIAAAEP